MTDASIAHQALRAEGYAPWYATVRWGTRERKLSSLELIDLCAAIELDRVQPADLERLWRLRSWSWRDLADGARGLTPEDARDGLSIGACLRRVGLVLTAMHVVTDGRLGAAIAKASQRTRRRVTV